jgi:hypothetical protein
VTLTQQEWDAVGKHGVARSPAAKGASPSG